MILMTFMGLGALISLPQRVVAQTADTVRARITTTAGAPVAGSTMFITPLGESSTSSGVADSNGRITVLVAFGTQQLLVVVRAAGFQEHRRTVLRNGLTLDLGDVTMTPAAVQTLSAVQVKETRRSRPPRLDGSASDPAAAQAGSPLAKGLSGDVTGNLSILAATIPGISTVTDASGNLGYSVLGLSSDQNNTTIQGVRTSAGEIPRDAAVNTRVALTTFDPARGGFSGGQTAIQVLPGSRYSTRSLHLTLDAPELQLTDPMSRRLGQTSTNTQVSGLLTGPVGEGRYLYNASAQLGIAQHATPAFSNDRLDGAIAFDADASRVTRALAAANRFGIGVTDAKASNVVGGSALLRFDVHPGAVWTGNIIGSGRWRQTAGDFATPFTAAGSSAIQDHRGADVIASLSGYVRAVVLNETRLGLTWNASSLTSRLDVPEVQVLTLGQPTDSGQPYLPLRFGGIAELPSSSSSRAAEFSNETSWNSLDGRHRLRLTVGGRGERVDVTQLPDVGVLTFESEDLFAANQPSSYTRRLGVEQRSVSVGSMAMSLADVWVPSATLRLQYGLRADGVAWPALRSADDALRAQFGLPSEAARRVADLSPRVGITYAYGSRSKLMGMGSDPAGTIRAGAGVFQDTPTAGDLVSFASRGDLGAAPIVRCVGAATPLPDWSAIVLQPSDAPVTCMGAPLLSQSTPDIALLSPEYRFSRSRRLSVGWAGAIGASWQADAELIASLTDRLPGVQDLNFSAIPQRQLADDGRPLFVVPAAIDTSSGRIALGASRTNAAFGQVRESMSALHARSTQLTVRVAPDASLGPLDVMFAYTLASYRSETNGFRGTTAGDPRVVEWGRAAGDSRHQINVTGTAYLRGGITASLWGRVSSGRPYTPLVASDINGDGLANDRAFVPRPGAGDSNGFNGLSALLAHAPGRVQSCLLGNAGGIAGQGSCEGPWSAVLNAQLRMRSPPFIRSQRLTATMTFVNVPAALDYALHGSSGSGWGQGATVDPALWKVTSYAPTAGRFDYQANPGFGRVLSARDGVRAPFQVTLDVRVALGPPRVEQLYRQSTTRAVTDSVAGIVRLRDQLAANFPNTPQEVLRVSDSLHLTTLQIGKLQALAREYNERSDAIWTPVAVALSRPVTLPGHHADGIDALRRGQEEAADLLAELGKKVKQIITPDQLRQLHPLFAALLDEYRVHDLLVLPF